MVAISRTFVVAVIFLAGVRIADAQLVIRRPTPPAEAPPARTAPPPPPPAPVAEPPLSGVIEDLQRITRQQMSGVMTTADDETRKQLQDISKRLDAIERSVKTSAAPSTVPSASPDPAATNATSAQVVTRGPGQADDSPLLPQAGVNVGKDASTVSLQAFEFLTTEKTRFYLRSTLPVTSSAPDNPKTEPSEALRAGILDPFGGLLNASLGYYAIRGSVTKRHLALDARVGLKLLETPNLDENENSDTNDTYETNPFGTAMAMIKGVLPLWRTLDTDRAGTLTIAAGGNLTTAASNDYLEGLTDIDRTTLNLTLGAAIDLPGVFYITIEGAPWSSSAGVGNRFVISVNALRKPEE